MKALIILAHGSRRDESNLEIIALSDKVRTLAGSDYDLVKYAFLELVEPSLFHTIEQCIDNGCSHISVLPYFLNSGNHVTKDIPRIIKTAEGKFPDCSFSVSDCIGMIEDMPRLVLELARED
jgi:sirohydrochlorin ferrochelatase